MASSSQRTEKIKALFKALQKRIKHVVRPVERTVLQHLIYAACLENATYEAADSALAVLEHHYIDWNEIRVSTASELADTFPQLPDPLAAGERIRKTLQAVFETTYLFDLEELKKKNISQAMEYINSIPACTRFMTDYTNQVALGGHVIPLDEYSFRVFRLLGISQLNKDKIAEEIPALERNIPKNQGILFATLLHQFSSEYCTDPENKDLRSFLKSIDPDSVKRTCEPPEFAKPTKQEPTREKMTIAPPQEILKNVAVEVVIEEDDDSITETVAVEEVEFIPSAFESSVSQEEISKKDSGTKKSTEKPKRESKAELKTAKKTPAPVESKPVKKEPKKNPAKKEEKTTAKKNAAKPPQKAKAPPPKAKTEKKPEKKQPSPKPAKKTDSGKKKNPHPKKENNPKSSEKSSPTRILRQKKPK